jgi:hypothetical protein
VGAGKVPDAKTMGRWGMAIGPKVLKQIHERIVKIAHEKGVTTDSGCAWIRRWWKQTFTIRLVAPCWQTEFGG